MQGENRIQFSQELLVKMDRPGPRYTSYPTADRFHEAFGAEQQIQALRQRACDGAGAARMPLSIYVHVPFCESICYYCACNKIVTKDKSKGAAYLEVLSREIDLVVGQLSAREPVTQIHFGGGTPTYLTDEELGSFFELLRSRFDIQNDGEFSIEVDPRTVDAKRLAALRKIGFNRLSFGVQDFDEDVQKAVHRVQPYEQVKELIELSRQTGFQSVNVDLIYGLPKQTVGSFERTIEQVSSLRPDRIAMYGYAHLPARFKPQRRIHDSDLPRGAERLGMLSSAIDRFIANGYRYIGMDHFALPDDPLSVAKRQGLLHRNFQGYSTQADCDLIGLGVSSISKIGATYAQNAKTLEEYTDSVNRGELPIVKGIALSRDDILRRSVIMAIMCHGRLSYESVEIAHLIDFRSYFAQELEDLKRFEIEGLLTIQSDGFELTELGWYFVRSVAMAFDQYVRRDQTREKFSKVI
jgi:oxygen-independent coproporphyrinogen-3 oxidase